MHPIQTYFADIGRASRTLWGGLKETYQHLKKGHRRRGAVGIERADYFTHADEAVTVQYPAEQLPVPDVGRYRLHMEADDCIVCDKCARVCPVDCIDITSIKATEDLGHTSDGSKKRLHLEQFDIDMAKCCYCGLCTTVCPTECLTMTKVYDFSEYNRDHFIYHFGILSPEAATEKREALAQAKVAQAAAPAGDAARSKASSRSKPKLRPRSAPPEQD